MKSTPVRLFAVAQGDVGDLRAPVGLFGHDLVGAGEQAGQGVGAVRTRHDRAAVGNRGNGNTGEVRSRLAEAPDR